MKVGLVDLGWNAFFEKAWADLGHQQWQAARLIRDNKISYGALSSAGEELEVILSGRVYHEAESDAELPAVGDWVALDRSDPGGEVVIRARLPRRSCFSRKEPGKSSLEQVIAANVDYVVVVTDPGADFNLRRMERYFALIERSRAAAIVIVNKSDLYPDDQVGTAVDAIQALNPKAKVFATSAIADEATAVLNSFLQVGKTVTVVGSSGVGKSTLINQILGEEYQWTSATNQATGKGRHTTTARELIVLEGGGVLVDNPGMREIQMWTDEQTLKDSFADVFALAEHCQFRDCRHQGDKGCAVEAAVVSGRLSQARLQSFLGLDDEIKILRKRQKRRKMASEKWAKRTHRVKARNLADRISLEKEQRGELE